MKGKGKWAIFIAMAIIVSLVMVSTPVAACFRQTTTCEGETVIQGDGGATDYWYDDLYPPDHPITAGDTETWIINVNIAGVCSNYEHLTVTDNTPPSGWTTTIEMGTIYSGSFTYIVGGGTVYEGDDIENKEIYLGRSCEFDIIYNITAPIDAVGGQYADMICTVIVVGYAPENQHDYVYVHCKAGIGAMAAPLVIVTNPNAGEVLSGLEKITWDSLGPPGSMSFDILLSSDGGATYPDLLASVGDMREWEWDTTAYPDDNKYMIKIIVFDGIAYGEGFSDGNFALNNYAPDPPTNLVIHFGLTTNGEPTAKAPEDNTGSDLERLYEDDKRGYMIDKGKNMSLETFNTTIQNDPVVSATLYVKYWINDTGYTGINSLMWKLETDIVWSFTDITPLASELTPTVKTFDLFANGVDTIAEIANLDIYFLNNDGGSFGPQGVVFDCLWITFKASTNDLGLTWLPSPSLDIDYYHIYRSTDSTNFDWYDETELTLWKDAGTASDMNNYFYKIHAVDIGDTESLLPTSTVAKFVTSFSDGWNLLSIPLIQQGDDSISTVMQSVDENYDNIWTFHAGYSRPWLHWHSEKPTYFNSLSNLNNVDGYYLEMQASGNLISLGIVPELTIIPLKAGWNLIGYPSIETQTANDALLNIAGNYDKVMRFDTAIDAEVEMLGGENMLPGNGYWIHATNNCDLIL